MSDARCEPPVHLREVDGWHWVQIADWPATVNRWVWDAHEGIGFWHPHISERTRYVSPVATPDELTRLRAELAAARNEIARLATQAAAMRDALLATGRTYSGVIPPLLPMPTGDAP